MKCQYSNDDQYYFILSSSLNLIFSLNRPFFPPEKKLLGHVCFSGSTNEGKNDKEKRFLMKKLLSHTCFTIEKILKENHI